jgi:hypothetical protein
MTTDHINRWNNMTDNEFLSSIIYYRRFKNVSSLEHSINIDYVVKRCTNLGYDFTSACCGRFTLTKKDDIQK